MDFLTNINIQFYILAYLVGGIPFGYLLAKYIGKVDVKSEGSGSIGATNVLRVLKKRDPSLAKKLGAATLALDALKGIAVLVLATIVGVSEETKWAIAVLAVVGHCFSPYLKFEGGKGIATGLGVMFYMLPLETIIAVVVWIISIKSFKISSLSSLLALIALVISSFIIHPDIPVIHTHAPIIIIAFIVIYKHIPNIVNLFEGKEKRIA